MYRFCFGGMDTGLQVWWYDYMEGQVMLYNRTNINEIKYQNTINALQAPIWVNNERRAPARFLNKPL